MPASHHGATQAGATGTAAASAGMAEQASQQKEQCALDGEAGGPLAVGGASMASGLERLDSKEPSSCESGWMDAMGWCTHRQVNQKPRLVIRAKANSALFGVARSLTSEPLEALF